MGPAPVRGMRTAPRPIPNPVHANPVHAPEPGQSLYGTKMDAGVVFAHGPWMLGALATHCGEPPRQVWKNTLTAGGTAEAKYV